MKKFIRNVKYVFLKMFIKKGVKTRPSSVAKPANSKSFYDFKMKANNGKEIDFANYKGKKVMVVNVASNCGYTNQYEELEKLYKEHKNELEIIGFPADDFLHQEPGNDDEIAHFCQVNFGVTFQLFQKSSVKKGEHQNPFFYWLSHKDQNGWNSTPPVWNFSKYLINEKGELINFFSPSVSPLSEDVIKQL